MGIKIMKHTKNILATFAVLAVLAGAAYAETNYYVDGVSGSDATGDGTQGNPWKSLTNA